MCSKAKSLNVHSIVQMNQFHSSMFKSLNVHFIVHKSGPARCHRTNTIGYSDRGVTVSQNTVTGSYHIHIDRESFSPMTPCWSAFSCQCKRGNRDSCSTSCLGVYPVSPVLLLLLMTSLRTAAVLYQPFSNLISVAQSYNILQQ